MRIDKFTSKLQSGLADAQSMAIGKDQNQLAPEHLIMALLDQQGGSLQPLLVRTGVDVISFTDALSQLIERLPRIKDNRGDIQISPELGQLLNLADKYSQQRGDQFISSECVLLAALDNKSDLGSLLDKFGIRKDTLERVIDQVRGGETVDDPNAEDTRQALEKFTVDLTAKATEGKLDPVIGQRR